MIKRRSIRDRKDMGMIYIFVCQQGIGRFRVKCLRGRRLLDGNDSVVSGYGSRRREVGL